MDEVFRVRKYLKYHLRQALHTGKRFSQGWNVDLHPSPIIIMGNQKAGTSAIAGLLAEATGKSVTIDVFSKMGEIEYDVLDNDLSFRCFRDRGKLYFSHDIVKEPEFVFFINELLHLYPESKFVFITRSPKENIRSMLNRLSPAKSGNNVKWEHIEKESKNAPLLKLLYDAERMPYEVNGIVETLAHRWSFVYGQLQTYADKMITVDYDSFKRNKIETIEALAEALGVPVKNSIEHIKNKQFQPAGHVKKVDQYFSVSDEKIIDRVCGNYELYLEKLSESGGLVLR
jgi:hypothetical protein